MLTLLKFINDIAGEINNVKYFDISQVCRITIVDDTASPRMEGNETFLVYLSSAMGSALSAPHEALIVINDTSDGKPNCIAL